MSPWDIPFCSRKFRIVSPIFIKGVSVNGNQSSTRWQAKSYDISSKDFVLSFLAITPLPRAKSTRFFETETLFFQRARKKGSDLLPGVGGVSRFVSRAVYRVLKTVARVGINRDIDFLPYLLQRLFEFLNVLGRDAAVLCAKQAQNRRLDFLQRLWIGCQMPVVNNVGGQFGFFQGKVKRVAAAHAPADCADSVLLHVRL